MKDIEGVRSRDIPSTLSAPVAAMEMAEEAAKQPCHHHSNRKEWMTILYRTCTLSIAMQPLAAGFFKCSLQIEPSFYTKPSENAEIAEQSCTAGQA